MYVHFFFCQSERIIFTLYLKITIPMAYTHHHTGHLIFVFIKFAWINLIYLIPSLRGVFLCDVMAILVLYCVECEFFHINMAQKRKRRRRKRSNQNDFVRWCTRILSSSLPLTPSPTEEDDRWEWKCGRY